MRLQLHREAAGDLREAKAFYRHHSPLAAIAFSQAVDAAMARIAESPYAFPVRGHGARELVFPRRFPFTVVYHVLRETIIVLAVAHHRREPGYWRDRL
jgi:plasmid stabilization system protein ParE